MGLSRHDLWLPLWFGSGWIDSVMKLLLLVHFDIGGELRRVYKAA
jgi:hypothetical protein